MKKIIAIALALTLATGAAFAADGDAGYAGAYLRSGLGARPLGMGGAFTGVAEGPEAPLYNPAGLGFNLKLGVSFSYKSLSLDRHLGHAAVSFPIRNEVAMAAGWVNAGVSNVEARGQSRQIAGNVANNQNAFTLSFAKAIDSSISFGGNLRYLQEKLDILDVFTIGVDLGIMYRYKNLVKVGGVVQNLGSTYRWDSSKYWNDGKTYDENLPIVMKLGVSGDLMTGRVIPAVDFEKSNKMGLRFRAGAEYWFLKKVTKKVEDEYEEGKFTEVVSYVRWAGLRAGLDRGTPTFGASYAYRLRNTSIAIEYAFLVGREGTSAGHLFTLRLGL